MSEALELKPCPFCGGEAKLGTQERPQGHLVECPACEIVLAYYDTPAEAVNGWNWRVGEERLLERVAALEAELERLRGLVFAHHESGAAEKLAGRLLGDPCPICEPDRLLPGWGRSGDPHSSASGSASSSGSSGSGAPDSSCSGSSGGT